MAVFNPGRCFHWTLNLLAPLSWISQPPESSENEFLFVGHSVCGTLFQQHEWAKTVSLMFTEGLVILPMANLFLSQMLTFNFSAQSTPSCLCHMAILQPSQLNSVLLCLVPLPWDVSLHGLRSGLLSMIRSKPPPFPQSFLKISLSLVLNLTVLFCICFYFPNVLVYAGSHNSCIVFIV